MKTNRKPSRRLRLAWLVILELLCVFGSVRCLALDPAKSVDQYNCQSWTQRENLPANSINAIAQTQDGYLWLGTDKGLARFDGFEFKLTAVPDPADTWPPQILVSGGWRAGTGPGRRRTRLG